jgi:D-sedoheptulose 7-phosphate isomerase
VKERFDFEERVSQSIKASIAVKQRLLASAEIISMVAKASEIVVDALNHGNKILLFGNGGSAADAQHIAAEFVGRFAFDRPALPALALSENSSSLTAIGNDYGFDLVFSRQVEAVGRVGDVAIGISTSAKKIGLQTIAFTGCSGGELARAVDHCISVPSNETARVQECHILIGHILSDLVERTIFNEQSCVSGS